jgi:hypothetical protein
MEMCLAHPKGALFSEKKCTTIAATDIRGPKSTATDRQKSAFSAQESCVEQYSRKRKLIL